MPGFIKRAILPEALERLTLDPADAPGTGGADVRQLRPRNLSAVERENLLVHAAWRRDAELPAEPAQPPEICI